MGNVHQSFQHSRLWSLLRKSAHGDYKYCQWYGRGMGVFQHHADSRRCPLDHVAVRASLQSGSVLCLEYPPPNFSPFSLISQEESFFPLKTDRLCTVSPALPTCAEPDVKFPSPLPWLNSLNKHAQPHSPLTVLFRGGEYDQNTLYKTLSSQRTNKKTINK